MTRKVLVTGGARGIGAAIAAAYREQGHTVATPSRSELDLAAAESIDGFARGGGLDDIDILINNAGENNIATLAELDFASWSRMLQINLSAAFALSRAAYSGMARRGWGRIVNMSSIYGIISRNARGGYSASKAGLHGLTRAAAIEFGPAGILVNAVAPGFVNTELTRRNNPPDVIAALVAQIPVGRLAEPAEIANVVTFLGGETNTYISGETIVVDGGYLAQ